MKIYRQLEHADCGFACIKMIASYYGKEIPVHCLREVSDYNRLGVSVNDIVETFHRIGMNAYAINIKEDVLDRLPLPSILFINNNHFIVLYKNKNNRYYYIADPAVGKVKYSREELVSHWLSLKIDNSYPMRGVVIVAEPSEEFHLKNYPHYSEFTSLLQTILRHFNDIKAKLTWAISLSLILMLADMLIPVLFQRTIDDGIGLGDISIVFSILLCQFGITLGSLCGRTLHDVIMTKLGVDLNKRLIKDFLVRFIKLPISYFDRKSTTDFLQRIDDQSRLKDFITSCPKSMIFACLNFCMFSIMLIYYSWKVWCIFLCIAIIEIFWSCRFLNRSRVVDSEKFSFYSLARNHILELLQGIHDIRINNGRKSKINRWEKCQDKISKYHLQSLNINIQRDCGVQLLRGVKDISILGMSAYMVINGDMTLGMMFTISYICGRLAAPIQDIESLMMNVQSASLANQRMEEINKDMNCQTGSQMPLNTEIVFSNVRFKYPGSNSHYVIDGLNLKVQSGETIALVGESGCGKSTLIKLMLGFYTPQKGEILLGGTNVEDLNDDAWLKRCAAVMQNGVVFSETIERNIVLSDEDVSYENLRNAIDIAGLKELVESMPNGIHTELGSAGLELSGGQKQRILIARAVYQHPDILFFDEATSSLDANNEKSIIEKITKFARGRTTIIAAHRLSTIKNCDRIIYLKDGKIVEQGTHDELLSHQKYYSDLISNQLK